MTIKNDPQYEPFLRWREFLIENKCFLSYQHSHAGKIVLGAELESYIIYFNDYARKIINLYEMK